MISLSDLLTEQRVACASHTTSKKRALELLSGLLVMDVEGLGQNEVFDSLFERERLGGTGLGQGVALPHGRLEGLDRAVCAFLRLNQGIDYDAPDRQPVDLICGLLVPKASTSEHLEILATLAEMFSDRAFCDRLRAAADRRELFRLLTGWQADDGFAEGRAAGP